VFRLSLFLIPLNCLFYWLNKCNQRRRRSERYIYLERYVCEWVDEDVTCWWVEIFGVKDLKYVHKNSPIVCYWNVKYLDNDVSLLTIWLVLVGFLFLRQLTSVNICFKKENSTQLRSDFVSTINVINIINVITLSMLSANVDMLWNSQKIKRRFNTN
jgi:hypothetical protein